MSFDLCADGTATDCASCRNRRLILNASALGFLPWCVACWVFGYFTKYLAGVVDKLTKVDLECNQAERSATP